MRLIGMAVFLLLTGCAAQGITSSTPVDMMNSIAKDTASNCFAVTAGPYSIAAARAGGPGVEVNQTGASCTIKTQVLTPLVLSPKTP